MTTDPRVRINTLCSKVEAGERGGTDDDRDALLEFSRQLDLLAQSYSDYRHEKLLRHCVRMAEKVGGLADALEDRSAAEEIVRWINQEYDNEETNRDYRSAIRVFGKRVAVPDDSLETNDDGLPESLAWIPTGTSSSYDPAPDPAKMLRWEEDVLELIDACRNDRDAAAIAIAFDSGLRSEELEELTWSQISDSEHSIQVFVDGKTGQRSVDLIPSIPYVNQWRAKHPDPTGDNPVWCRTDRNEVAPVSYRTFLNMFKEPAKRCDVDKPVTPRNFRRSNASWLARMGASAHLIEDRQGRKRGSKMAARYVARFGSDAEAQYAQLLGLEVETETDEENAPVVCPRCGESTPSHEPQCVWCGQALSPEAAEQARELNSEVRELIARYADQPEVLRAFLTIGDAIDEDPAVRRLLDD